MHYETDTAPGSSGSPVFNDQWEVVALHHSGVPRKDEQGRLLTREGGLWTPEMGEHRIDWVANEGARISRVVRHVKRQRLSSDAQRRLRTSIFETAPVSLSHTRRADEPTPLSGSFGDATSIGQDGSAV